MGAKGDPREYFETPAEDYRVRFDGTFRVKKAATIPPRDAPERRACKAELGELTETLADLQRRLYARDRHAILCIFQAMDAAGKDSTIRAVMTGVNPAGFQVYSFKQPSREELDHDFLWRSTVRLPERGRIGIFNRSYYEEVLVVRVHPEYLRGQNLPEPYDHERFWEHRFESIREHERHLARNGTVILKFWLNVSSDEQRRRFLDRIDTPRKRWKFSEDDVAERTHWDAYMAAYEEALNETSRPWAPWFAIPADDKPFMRLSVARILERTLDALDLRYPDFDSSQLDRLMELREALEHEPEEKR